MGLFGSKEVCPVCGKRIRGDVLVKIKDNVPLCRECSAMVNMDAALIPLQSAEDMKRHLAYRERNLEKYERFHTTLEAKAGLSLLCVDEVQMLWYCIRNRREKNPPLFDYGEILDFQYLEDGQPVEEEEKKGVFGTLFGGKKEEAAMLHSMKVHIVLDNPYTKTIDLEMIAANDGVRSGSLGYKANRKALDRVMDILKRITGIAESCGQDMGDGISREQTGAGITGEESEQEIIEKYDHI